MLSQILPDSSLVICHTPFFFFVVKAFSDEDIVVSKSF